MIAFLFYCTYAFSLLDHLSQAICLRLISGFWDTVSYN